MSNSSSDGLGKLFQLKTWVELGEATRALSILIGEETSCGDLLRLGLEGHLILSVRFLCGVQVKCGRAIPIAEATQEQVPTLDGEGFVVLTRGAVIGDGRVIVFEDNVSTISDIWDLPMFGGERIEIEKLYERGFLRYGPEVVDLDGTFVTDGNGLYCQLLDRFDRPLEGDEFKNQPHHPSRYFPAGGLPEDSTVVVRTSALRDLAARLNAERASIPKPLGPRERTTLLTIAAALAQMAKVNIAKPSSAAASIERQTELMGSRVAARTIEEHLKRMPEALATRQQ